MKHLIVSAVIFYAACAASFGAPRILFQSTNVDLGYQLKYGYLRGNFTFTNTGDSVLTIGSVEPDCGCTTATARPAVIEPGQTGLISFKLHLVEIDGKSEKKIAIISNDPNSSKVSLSIVVNTAPMFNCLPEEGNIGDLCPGSRTNIVVVVRRDDSKRVNITRVVSTDKNVDAHFDNQSDPSGLSVELWIDVKAGSPGPFVGGLSVFEGDDERLPSFYYLVKGNVLPVVSIYPNDLFWGIDEPGTLTTNSPMTVRTIQIVANESGSKLKVRRITSDISELSFDMNAGADTKKASILAHLTQMPKQSARGKIDITIDSPTSTELHVPVTIEVHGR
jgi:hypothetical protein